MQIREAGPHGPTKDLIRIAVHNKVGNNFDFIRFFFASLVIFSHAYPLAVGNENAEPLLVFSEGQLTFGTLAVYGFFVISGYLIAQSWTRNPVTLHFLEKRVRRIYPGFLLASIISAFVVAPLFNGDAGRSVITLDFVLEFLSHAGRLIFLQPGASFLGNPSSGPVNGSLWSIPYEFWCYIGVLAAGVSGYLYRARVLIVTLIGAMLVGFVFEKYNLKISGNILGQIFGYPPFWARLLPFFMAGMLFFALGERIDFTPMGALLAFGAIVFACRIPLALKIVLPVALTYLVLWFAFTSKIKFNGFAKYGDFSYGIYLYGFPLEQIVVYWTKTQSHWMVFFLAWPCSIVFGALSWYLVESRFMGRSLYRRRASAEPPMRPNIPG